MLKSLAIASTLSIFVPAQTMDNLILSVLLPDSIWLFDEFLSNKVDEMLALNWWE